MAKEGSEDSRVLSIQSHVVHGYVGNRSAVFPMQLLGLEVDVLNTVHFSNHTGYKKFRGERLNGDQLLDIIAGLEENDLINYTHLLTGYIGNPSLLRAITTTLQKLRQRNPSLIYVCDPVMGDDNRLYVPPELVDIYRDEVLPFADIITPNQFECELLSGQSLKGDADVIAACQKLHALGPRIVIISSFVPSSDSEFLWLYASEQVNGISNQYKMQIPRLKEYYSGTGDMFAALSLAWLSRYPTNLKLVLEKVIATIQAVMKRTSEAKSAYRELRLIQSRHDIESPQVVIHAQLLHSPITHVVLDSRAFHQETVAAELHSAGVATILLTYSTQAETPSSAFTQVSVQSWKLDLAFAHAFSWSEVCAKAGVLPVNALFLSQAASATSDNDIEYHVATDVASAVALISKRKQQA
ncbi:hypothetical protein LEN26_000490 [Aphanomyces euteiches]|nr:hypothetical protein AeMF1_002160 [Aphanomyces euteiches]KAH9163498.1 hypothetical protein LEN26_000490 [Aphanomyces euteiches]